jgi:hypothetical protein
MRGPRSVTDVERQALLAEAHAEFPDDEMMREVHYVRLLHGAQMQDLAPAERIAYLNRLLPSATRPR